MQTATAFWPSKVLLTAVELDLFSSLADGPMTGSELSEELGIHPRGTYDFFDALVALGSLNRNGDGPNGQYANTPETAAFLVTTSPADIGGFLRAISGLQARNFELLAERFDFSEFETLTDAGGALALLSRTIASQHPHMRFKCLRRPTRRWRFHRH